MGTNYYDLLDISEDDSIDTVRTAYRQKVKEYHPDLNDHPDAQERFKQLKEAYEVLNNRGKRQRYDEMGHAKYVQQYSGYTSHEIEQTTEIQLQRRNGISQDSTKETNSKETISTESHSGTAEDPSGIKRQFEWILQGKTAESDGRLANIIRILLYCFLVLLCFLLLIPVYGSLGIVLDSSVRIVAVLLSTRLVYLILFERLRHQYVKIDNQPEPDAYTIPFALGIVTFGLFCSGFSLIILQSHPKLATIPFLVGTIPLLFGEVLTIQTIGWGVADDYYNLGYDVNPILWNFAAQSPVLLILSGMLLDQILLLIPPIVATLYLVLYHREIGSELKSRIQNWEFTSVMDRI